MTMAMSIFVLLILIATLSACATLMMSVPVILGEIAQFHCLLHIHFLIGLLLFHASQGFTHLRNLFGLQIIRKLDFEDYEEVTLFVGLLVEGHTGAINSFDIIRLYDLTWSISDAYLASI